MGFPEPTVWWLVTLRGLSYLLTLVLVGIVVGPAVGLRSGPWRAVVATLALSLLVIRAGLLGGQAWLLFGPGVIDRGMIAAVAFETRWGVAWWLQCVAAMVAAAGAAWAGSRPSIGWRLAVLGALASAALVPATGHAAEQGLMSRAMAQQALHVIAAGSWIGCLGLVWRAVGIDRDPAEVAATMARFSSLALVSAGGLVASGGLTAWSYVGSPAALLSSAYGRTLTIKLALVAAVAATGAYNWRRVLPRLAAPGGVARLRRTAGIELLLALLVTAATAVLVGLPQPSG